MGIFDYQMKNPGFGNRVGSGTGLNQFNQDNNPNEMYFKNDIDPEKL